MQNPADLSPEPFHRNSLEELYSACSVSSPLCPIDHVHEKPWCRSVCLLLLPCSAGDFGWKTQHWASDVYRVPRLIMFFVVATCTWVQPLLWLFQYLLGFFWLAFSFYLCSYQPRPCEIPGLT